MNSFGPDDQITEKKIKQKMQAIRNKEKAHLEMVNIQR